MGSFVSLCLPLLLLVPIPSTHHPYVLTTTMHSSVYLGTVQALEKGSVQTNALQTVTEIEQRDVKLEEDWLVRKSEKRRGDQSDQPVHVLSVYFEGRLECEAWDCGK